jgi:hypothetical protein
MKKGGSEKEKYNFKNEANGNFNRFFTHAHPKRTRVI